MKQSAMIALLIASLMGSSEVKGQETINLPRQTFQIYIGLTQELGQELKIVEKRVESLRPTYSIPLDDKLLDHIWKESKNYDINYELVLALIKVESNYKAKAVSYNGTSLGLMQLNKNTYPWLAKEVGIKNFNVNNPYHNTTAGIWYLAYLRDQWRGNGLSEARAMERTLLSYNRGLAGARNYVKQHGSRSSYTVKVINNKNKLLKGE